MILLRINNFISHTDTTNGSVRSVTLYGLPRTHPTRKGNGARLNVMLDGEALEEVDQFKYLGSVSGSGCEQQSE